MQIIKDDKLKIYCIEWKIFYSNSYVLIEGEEALVFDKHILISGDEMLSIPTVTRLPGGDTKKFWFKDIPWFESISKHIFLTCPGHGNPGILKDMISINIMPEKLKRS